MRVEAVSTQQMNIEIELMYTSDGRNVVVEGSCSDDLSWSKSTDLLLSRSAKKSSQEGNLPPREEDIGMFWHCCQRGIECSQRT